MSYVVKLLSVLRILSDWQNILSYCPEHSQNRYFYHALILSTPVDFSLVKVSLPFREKLGPHTGTTEQGGRQGALCIQMDFTQTFQTNDECNKINHVWSHFCKSLVVLKYHNSLWTNIFDTHICMSINIPKKVKHTTLM